MLIGAWWAIDKGKRPVIKNARKGACPARSQGPGHDPRPLLLRQADLAARARPLTFSP